MEHGNDNKHAHHHIIPTKLALAVGGGLLFLTALTVFMAGVDLGALNFLVAMVVATIKALLVALFFMGLIWDSRENGVIFVTAFLFLAIFFTLTSMDLFFRGDVYVKGPLVASAQASKLKKPWISTPELVAHGKELFEMQCVACHGPQGHGDGPASTALNPKPRNFTQAKDWVNGRKETMVFKTLKEGVPGSAMASFATLPADDRWALDAYVLSLGPGAPDKDTPEDFKKIGVDPNSEGGGEAVAATVPVEFAMKMLAAPEATAQTARAMPETGSQGGQLYTQYCASCHGDHGQGGVRVKTLAMAPSPAYIESQPFRGSSEALSSEAAFNKIVIDGLPGNLMPNFGQLSGMELSELRNYVHALAK